MKKLLLTFLLVGLAVPVLAAEHEEPVFKVYAGTNAVWFQGSQDLPSDFEVGASGRASMSPHISLTSSVFFGLDNSYVRGTGGVRVTATEVDNKDFSVGFGMEYQASSEPRLRPQEWAATASVGWKPWPETVPYLVLGGQGSYGLSSEQASAMVALRYYIGSF
jgi:hypothetical protein